MNLKRATFFIFLALICLPHLGLAQDRSTEVSANSAEDMAREKEIAQKVKSRSYPGGSDESDLKVQNQLTKPSRRVAPTADDTSEPASQD